MIRINWSMWCMCKKLYWYGLKFVAKEKEVEKELGCFYMLIGIFADDALGNTSIDVYVKKCISFMHVIGDCDSRCK
jgi:hypothetical protein